MEVAKFNSLELRSIIKLLAIDIFSVTHNLSIAKYLNF